MIRVAPARRAASQAGPILILAGLILFGAAMALGWLEFDEDLERWGRGAAWLAALGRALGLGAAALLLAQVLLSARLKWLDRVSPLDRRLVLHSWVGRAAVVLASIHPLLMLASPDFNLGPVTWRLWPYILGGVLLLGLWVTVIVALKREFLRVPYQPWRAMHRLGHITVLLVLVHAAASAEIFESLWGGIYLTLLAAGTVAVMIWLKLIKPAGLRSHAWEVAKAEPLNDQVTGLELSPPDGLDFAFLPGQFAFITPLSGSLPREEHPFTISSAPDRSDALEFSIKASGDFTEKLCAAAAGDRFRVDGPYGRFSYLIHPSPELVMVAGGIGITPMLSMVRHLAAQGDDRPCTLVWVNRTEAELVRRAELEELAGSLENLSLHLVLTRQENWQGPKGRLDESLLGEMLGDCSRKAEVFLCGPPAMMAATRTALGRLGFKRVRSELFSLTK